MKINGKTVYDGVLDIPEGRSGEVYIEHDIKPAGEKLMLVHMRSSLFGRNHGKVTSIVYNAPTRWHKLMSDKNGTWTTDWPVEQFQQDRDTEDFRGRVLIGGLGVGYIAKSLSLKKSVKEIVIVELNQHVVNLVWEHIRTPKMKIVVADLFEYVKNNKEPFDYAFYDIWQSDGEMTFYDVVIPLREYSRAFGMHDKNIRNWNEDLMRGQVRHGLQNQIMMHMNPEMKDFKFTRVWDLTEDQWKQLSQHKPFAMTEPFFRWVVDVHKKLDEATIQRAGAFYSEVIGMHEWQKKWDSYKRRVS